MSTRDRCLWTITHQGGIQTLANPDWQTMLRTDVQEFNTYRENNPGIPPDLENADLSQANLAGANLSRANLRHANLEGADLGKVLLARADLSGANLRGANLREASFHMAKMTGCDLTGARVDFIESSLRICLHPDNFANVRFDREQLTAFLEILNSTLDWEIEYTLKPKKS